MRETPTRYRPAEMYHGGRAADLSVVLVSPYELGRQPFGLAEPAAWLRRAGFSVTTLDLAQQTLEPDALAGARLVAIHLAMHTAARIAAAALPRIRALAPAAHLCIYGLYAPVNAAYFRSLGVASVLGGESEPALLELAERLRSGDARPLERLDLTKISFIAPDRTGLPELARYAELRVPGEAPRTIAFTEASRGCKHLCRHCPVVPVYEGRFRIVPAPIVLGDIAAQIRAGARHVSFGDPDFLNGPTHALRVVRGLHDAHPDVSYDAVIKVEHLLRHAELLPELARTGCLFITTAVESVDDDVLEKLAKNHTARDFESALRLVTAAGISLAPTFVAFTPWTTLTTYRELLASLVRLGLVHAVPPIQLAIRLLVPAGSHLLRIPGFEDLIDPFDPALLGYPWSHRDPRVDELQRSVLARVESGEREGGSRRETFEAIWRLNHAALGEPPPALPAQLGREIPHHSEPWYCCAEPTDQQLQSF